VSAVCLSPTLVSGNERFGMGGFGAPDACYSPPDVHRSFSFHPYLASPTPFMIERQHPTIFYDFILNKPNQGEQPIPRSRRAAGEARTCSHIVRSPRVRRTRGHTCARSNAPTSRAAAMTGLHHRCACPVRGTAPGSSSARAEPQARRVRAHILSVHPVCAECAATPAVLRPQQRTNVTSCSHDGAAPSVRLPCTLMPSLCDGRVLNCEAHPARPAARSLSSHGPGSTCADGVWWWGRS
jgi:hypothetical protein